MTRLRPSSPVRVHLGVDEPSFTGFRTRRLRGRLAGMYVLERARMHQTEDVVVEIDGRCEIPIRKIMFVQTQFAVAT